MTGTESPEWPGAFHSRPLTDEETEQRTRHTRTPDLLLTFDV
jgi:hypothetical protein